MIEREKEIKGERERRGGGERMREREKERERERKCFEYERALIYGQCINHELNRARAREEGRIIHRGATS